RGLSVCRKSGCGHFFEEEKDSASAEAGIFHCQPRLTAVKNVRKGFGKAETAPRRRETRRTRMQSADGEFVAPPQNGAFLFHWHSDIMGMNGIMIDPISSRGLHFRPPHRLIQ
ncbi:MAG: hypothetical protein ACI4ME_05000, partial [Aristaeellaceae bacterium]